MYTVIKAFGDITDGFYTYKEGDTYPREGVEVSEARIKELSTSANRMGEPLIKKPKPKKTKE